MATKKQQRRKSTANQKKKSPGKKIGAKPGNKDKERAKRRVRLLYKRAGVHVLVGDVVIVKSPGKYTGTNAVTNEREVAWFSGAFHYHNGIDGPFVVSRESDAVQSITIGTSIGNDEYRSFIDDQVFPPFRNRLKKGAPGVSDELMLELRGAVHLLLRRSVESNWADLKTGMGTPERMCIDFCADRCVEWANKNNLTVATLADAVTETLLREPEEPETPLARLCVPG